MHNSSTKLIVKWWISGLFFGLWSRYTFHNIGSSPHPSYFITAVVRIHRDTQEELMPTLTEEKEDAPHAIPRSTIRHRPLGPHPQVRPFVVVQTPRATRGKPHQEPHTTGGPPSRRTPSQGRGRSLFTLGTGMFVTLMLVFLGQLLLAWVNTSLDDLHYGRPRTYQTDAVVGHGDSAANPSHFIAVNLRGHIEIIELPGGDPAHAKIYVGPQLYGPGADLAPVTLQFRDPQHTHHPDMIVLFQNGQAVFHNMGGGFQPQGQ
jgi:hypothetical protein